MLFGNQWKSREQLQRKKAPSAPNFTHPKLTIYDNKAAGVQGRCFGFWHAHVREYLKDEEDCFWAHRPTWRDRKTEDITFWAMSS